MEGQGLAVDLLGYEVVLEEVCSFLLPAISVSRFFDEIKVEFPDHVFATELAACVVLAVVMIVPDTNDGRSLCQFGVAGKICRLFENRCVVLAGLQLTLTRWLAAEEQLFDLINCILSHTFDHSIEPVKNAWPFDSALIAVVQISSVTQPHEEV